METSEIMLNKNANVSTMEELASYLLDRINELIPEYEYFDENDPYKDYLGGLIAAFENVLINIGYPSSKLPKYEEIL